MKVFARLCCVWIVAAILCAGCMNAGPAEDGGTTHGPNGNQSGTGNGGIANEGPGGGSNGNKNAGNGSGQDTGGTTGGTGGGGAGQDNGGIEEGNVGGGDEAEKTRDAVWMAVGDIMMHMPQLPGAYDNKSKTYNFNAYFDPVKPILTQGDWTLANLETPIAGQSLGLSGFPRFNAPVEVAASLKHAGFDIVTTANNHALDRGFEGVSKTLKALEKKGLAIKGTARSQAEADKLTIVERNGIRMGLLAFTYGTNGIPLPKDKPYAVSLIDEPRIIRDIGRLRDAGADFITVALHFGTEYQTVPSDAQKKLARKLIAAGADIIAGSHPHVVQPYETVEVAETDGTVRRGLIIYSMGNFLSNQRGDTKDYGVIFKVRIRKEKGVISISDVEPIPTWVHRYRKNGVNRYEIVPLEQTVRSRSIQELGEAGYKELSRNLKLLTQRLASMSAKPYPVQASGTP
jgi:poly-gamma-glutamate capsule biosynthesis protein CapA/YwtB (metallophosphatase superfamily)